MEAASLVRALSRLLASVMPPKKSLPGKYQSLSNQVVSGWRFRVNGQGVVSVGTDVSGPFKRWTFSLNSYPDDSADPAACVLAEIEDHWSRTGGVTQTSCEKLRVRGARHNPSNPRSFFCSQPSCDTVNKFVSETVLPNSFRAPTEPAWGHPRGVDQVKLRVLEASLV